MKTPAIRPIAIGIFRRGDQILVGHANDVAKGEHYCRPPGGGIEFGEKAADALRREIREETHAEVGELRQVAVLENLFDLEGQPRQEIIFVFEATFQDPALYQQDAIVLHEPGWDGSLRWEQMATFRDGTLPLYPDGLLELLEPPV